MFLRVIICGKVEVVGFIPSLSLELGHLHLAHLGSCQRLLVAGLFARLKEDGWLQLAASLTLFFMHSFATTRHIQSDNSLLLLSPSVTTYIT